MTGLVFDEKTHSYTYDGRRLPGVTRREGYGWPKG